MSYAYLWPDEKDKGHEERLKNRPVVVVVGRIVKDDRTELMGAPIPIACLLRVKGLKYRLL